jgi:phosphoribosylformylglycinamidine synthase
MPVMSAFFAMARRFRKQMGKGKNISGAELTGARAFLYSTSPRGVARRRRKMKAKIIVTPKKAVLDPQGKTVQSALEHMGYKGIGAVHVGKYMEIELPGTDREAWRKQIDEACHKILSNPVIEDYKFEIE